MAMACKCDRCGALYEQYATSLIGTVTPSHFNGISFTRTLAHATFNDGITHYGDIQDLCPDCMAELRDWFTMETKKEEDIHGQTDS